MRNTVVALVALAMSACGASPRIPTPALIVNVETNQAGEPQLRRCIVLADWTVHELELSCGQPAMVLRGVGAVGNQCLIYPTVAVYAGQFVEAVEFTNATAGYVEMTPPPEVTAWAICLQGNQVYNVFGLTSLDGFPSLQVEGSDGP